MSITHAIDGPFPDLASGQAGWEAAHAIADATITAAMLADAYDAAGAAATAQAAAIAAAATDATTKANAAQAASQPLDSDLTAIAALSTTSYGRAFLVLADAAAGRTALALGTAAVAATGDFDAAGAAATALTSAEAYTDSSVAALLTQAQVLTRGLGS